jgi:hypothetical protein
MTTRNVETSLGNQASLVSSSSEPLTRSASNPDDLSCGPFGFVGSAKILLQPSLSHRRHAKSRPAARTRQIDQFFDLSLVPPFLSVAKIPAELALPVISHPKPHVKPHYPLKATSIRVGLSQLSFNFLHRNHLISQSNPVFRSKTPPLVVINHQTTTACGFSLYNPLPLCLN